MKPRNWDESYYIMVQYFKLIGLALLLSVGLGSVGSAASNSDVDSSKLCEDGASNMAEVYQCLDDQRALELTNIFDELSEQLLSAGLSDKLQFLQSSQNAQTASTKLYCHTLMQISQPKLGMYAKDIQNNCHTELTNRRIQDLSLLLGALVEENFVYWQ